MSDRIGSEAGLGAFRDYERFLDLIPSPLLVVQPTSLIVFVNQEAASLFGYPRDELIGEHFEILIPEPHRDPHSARMDAYLADAQGQAAGLRLDLVCRRKDGGEFAADVRLSAMESENGAVATIAVHEAPEARNDQAQRLESIGELAGGVAHDFNNLLAVIRSNAELALEGAGPSGAVPEDEADWLREELEEVRGAADHAAELTSQLLVFSRRGSTAREPVDLNAVVEDVQQLLQRSIGDHIDLQVDLARDLPPAFVDRNQMEQILLNLAINARDAMPSGGRVSITTAVAELDERDVKTVPELTPGTYVLLAVADTGTGMSREVAARAFEPFFSTKPKGEGTGLGLATVYGIVQASGGHVSIHSEVGSGTEIRAYFPLADAAPGPAATATTVAVPRRGEGQTILVVEDADRVRRAVARVLQRGGYQVVQASEGDEAFEIIERGEVAVDLLLTDVQMPGITGTELAAKVRTLRPELPVLFMSAYAGESTPIEARDRIIEKPFTMDRMLGQVAEVLDSATRDRRET